MPRKSLFLILFLEIITLFFHVNLSYAEPGTLKWFFTSEYDFFLNSAPAIGLDGTIYIAASDGDMQMPLLYAIDKNGYKKWRYELPYAIKDIALGHDNSIYIGFSSAQSYNNRNKIIAINPDGTKKWEHEFDFMCCDSGDRSRSLIFSNLAIGPYGTIYITVAYIYCYSDCDYSYIDDWAITFVVHAIDPEGNEKWQCELNTGYSTSGGPGEIIIGNDGSIYVNIDLVQAPREELYSLTWYSTKNWSLDDSFFSLVTDNNQTIYTNGHIYPEPTEEDPYPASEFSGVFALDSDLNIKWESDINSLYSAYWIIDNNQLYYIDNNLYSINSLTGQKIWMIEPGNYKQYFSYESSPVLGANQMIYAATVDGYLHAFDKNGNETWKFDTGADYIRSSPAITKDGTLYIGSGKRLYAINTESGGLADSDWPMFAHDPRHTNSLAGPDPDNDGINIRYEDVNQNRIIDEGETDPHNIDSDEDGIHDGTELGITLSMIGWDTDTTIFQPDLDPGTRTNPMDADTDDDSIPDGLEDTNHNGKVDPGETDPCNPDTDGDGIQDGTELGLTLADIGPNTDTNVFQPDLDPLTTTNPLDSDTDGDGFSDGMEDSNHNGQLDAGETDPLVVNIDTDSDGIVDILDNCLSIPNPDQIDSDENGVGDVCDDDIDGDGIANDSDNCPGTYNPNQMDSDGDGIGNACDDKIIPWTLLLLLDD